jgi:hypothetical protein
MIATMTATIGHRVSHPLLDGLVLVAEGVSVEGDAIIGEVAIVGDDDRHIYGPLPLVLNDIRSIGAFVNGLITDCSDNRGLAALTGDIAGMLVKWGTDPQTTLAMSRGVCFDHSLTQGTLTVSEGSFAADGALRALVLMRDADGHCVTRRNVTFDGGPAEVDARRAFNLSSEIMAELVRELRARLASTEAAWSHPRPLGAGALPPFPTSTFPRWLHEYVEALAKMTQTPPDVAAMMALSTVAATVARKAIVSPEPWWAEPLNIFTVSVLGSGNRKSAVERATTGALVRWETRTRVMRAPDNHAAQSKRRIAEKALAKAERDAAEEQDTEKRRAAAQAAAELAREVAALPDTAELQLIADDATPETLKTLLAEQGGRIAILSAEGTVFELMSGRYSTNNAPNLEVYLHGHAGDRIVVNRRGRHETIDDPALTIGVTVQPDVLQSFSNHPSLRRRGLTARFLYALPESYVGRRAIGPPPIPEPVAAAYEEGLVALANLPLSPIPHQLLLDPAATTRFRAFQRAIEPQLGEFGRLGDMADWGSKLPGAVARIAGLLHLATHALEPAPWAVPIPLDTIEAAIRIGEYAIPHALAAADAMGWGDANADAAYLLRWLSKRIEAEGPLAPLAEQVIWQATKRRFGKADRLRSAINVLVDHGYLRLIPVERKATGQPPRPTYATSPYLMPRTPATPRTEDSVAPSRGCRGSRQGEDEDEFDEDVFHGGDWDE